MMVGGRMETNRGRRVGGALIAAVVVLSVGVGLTLFALEGREVIVLHTVGEDGEPDQARIWIADDGASLWIEAATTNKAFYRNLVAHADVEVVRGQRVLTCRAEPRPYSEAHDRMRALFAEKYGAADAWVGLLVDTSASTAVLLTGCRDVRPADAR